MHMLATGVLACSALDRVEIGQDHSSQPVAGATYIHNTAVIIADNGITLI